MRKAGDKGWAWFSYFDKRNKPFVKIVQVEIIETIHLWGFKIKFTCPVNNEVYVLNAPTALIIDKLGQRANCVYHLDNHMTELGDGSRYTLFECIKTTSLLENDGIMKVACQHAQRKALEKLKAIVDQELHKEQRWDDK